MNCNKCGTPILPGENSCRFCGTVGDYSRRKMEEQPEIIDFTAGNDDVVIIDDDQPLFDTPVVPTFLQKENTTSVSLSDDLEPVMPMEEKIEEVLNNTITTPLEIPVEKEEDKISKIQISAIATPIKDIPEFMKKDACEPKKEEIAVPEVETSVSENVTTTSEKSEVSSSEPIVIQGKEDTVKEEQVKEEDKKEQKNNSQENKTKSEKTNHGLFNILTFILIILLIVSIIVNCFLLMGHGEDNKVEEKIPTVSSTKQTIYFSGYKAEVPSNWINVNDGVTNFLVLMDNTEDWSATINIAFNTKASDIETEDNIKNITNAFGNNKYIFSSDYSKTVEGKNYHIFKGKYSQLYAVYVITTPFDENNTVVTELKFKGEVDESVVNGILGSMSTVSKYDLTSFYSNDFGYSNIVPILSGSVVPNTNQSAKQGN